jgi:hypothetical protein
MWADAHPERQEDSMNGNKSKWTFPLARFGLRERRRARERCTRSAFRIF